MRGNYDRVRLTVLEGGWSHARRVRTAGLLALALVTVAALALGTGRARATIAVNTLFSGGQGSAAWTTAADKPGDTDGQTEGLQLTVPNGASYAGIELQNESSTPPATPPSFWSMSSVSGPAQSAPRLVIAFTDGGYIDLHPANWTAGAWVKVDGATPSWDDPGQGNCRALQSVSYQTALACHVAHGASVSEVFLVSDATYPGGYVNSIDDISYAGATIVSSTDVIGPPGVKAASTPDVTQFAFNARVALARGAGTLAAACQIPSDDHCHFKLTVTATVKSGGKKRSVKVGTVTGTMSGKGPAGLHIALNASGRLLLLAHQGGLPVVVSGPVTDDSGLAEHFTKNLTLTAS
jgi:hypothetical protein